MKKRSSTRLLIVLFASLCVCPSSYAQQSLYEQLSDQFRSSGGTGDFGRSSQPTAPQGRANQSAYDFSGLTNNQSPVSRGGLEPAATALLAPDSAYIDKSPIPSGDFKFGFPEQSGQPYRGVTSGRAGARSSQMAMLPATATTSVDVNTCDLPFLRRHLGYPNPWSPPGALAVAGPPVVLPPGPGSTGTNPGGSGGGSETGGNQGGNGYVSGAPSYRYTADGGYMTGSGIVVYPNGRKVPGGPMFMYRSGYGFTDLRNPSMGWTWDRSAVYRPYG
ncbi:MAG: hypothetical protein K2Y39_18660 [Candidatus Obscuribacterales bacterium]|nr:hypothetical protein [Candidatus Obscuribacterales bacterium]